MATNAISGKIAAFYKQSGTATAMTDEACTDSGDHKNYYITSATKRYIDPDTTVVVEKQTDGEGEFATVSSGYTIQYLGGYVVFDEANGADDVIQVTGKYLPTTQLVGAFNWSLSVEVDMHEVTDFADSGHKNYIAGNKGWTGECEMYWIADTETGVASNELSSDLGDRLVCVFYVDDTNDYRYEGFGRITNINPSASVGDIISQSISIQGTGTEQLRYREG